MQTESVTGKRLKEINLKLNMPTVREALDYMQFEISKAKVNHIGCFIFIHGYGSHGVGGQICNAVRARLKKQQGHEVKTVIFGEEFDIFNPSACELKRKYKELEIYTKVCNHGITIVEM